MFKKKNKQEENSKENLTDSKFIDELSLQEAEETINKLSKQDREARKNAPIKPIEANGSKFGYIEETNPNENIGLTPINNQELNSSFINQDTQNISDDLTPINVDLNSYSSHDNQNIGIQNEFGHMMEEFKEPISLNLNNSSNEANTSAFKEIDNDIPIIEEDEPKKPKKPKKIKEPKEPRDKEKTIKMVMFGTVSLLIIVLCVILFIPTNKTDNKEVVQSGGQDIYQTIENNKNNTGDKTEVNNSRIEVLNNYDLSLNETLSSLGKLNNIIPSYIIDIASEVEGRKNDSSIKYIENDMALYKEAILMDLQSIQNYKKPLEKYNGLELYESLQDRLQNAYLLADSTKNTMTKEALVENTNYYINKEIAANESTTNLLISYLNDNNVSFEQKDGTISYVPVVE